MGVEVVLPRLNGSSQKLQANCNWVKDLLEEHANELPLEPVQVVVGPRRV